MEKSDGTEHRFIKTEHGLYYLDTVAMTGGHSVVHGMALVAIAAEAILGPNVDSLKGKKVRRGEPHVTYPHHRPSWCQR